MKFEVIKNQDEKTKEGFPYVLQFKKNNIQKKY